MRSSGGKQPIVAWMQIIYTEFLSSTLWAGICSGNMGDAKFFGGLMMCYDIQRRKRFNFLLELAKYLVKRDEEVEACLSDQTNSDCFRTVAEQVRRTVQRFWTEGDPRCREEICRAVRALYFEPSFPHMEIERSLTYHGNHLKRKLPECYFQFFACFGFLCRGAATWKKEHMFKIIKEAEEVMHTYAHTFPGFGGLYKYAEEILLAGKGKNS